MKVFVKVIEGMSEWTGKVSGFLIYPGLILILYEIVARYVFKDPTTWVHDVNQQLFAFLYIIGGAYVLRYKSHISMDLIYGRLNLRKKAIIGIIVFPFLFAFCGALLWHGSLFASESLRILELTGTTSHLPIYFIKLAIPLAAFLIMLQALLDFVRNFIIAITGRQCEY